MAKVTSYADLAAPSSDDILYIVDSGAGTPTSKKVKVKNLLKSLSSALGAAGTSGQVLTIAAGVPAWATPTDNGISSAVSSGAILYGDADGAAASLAPPTSGAVLTFSTTTNLPVWSKPTSGAVFIGSSVGIPTWLTQGASGSILHVSSLGKVAWLAPGTTGQYLTVGTSAGELAWSSARFLPSTVGAASGALTYISTAGTPAWLAPGTTGQYLTVGTSAGELTWSSARLLPSTVGAGSGAISYISTAGEPAWLAAGTTGQYLRVKSSAGEIGWSNPTRYVTMQLFSTGTAIASGPAGYLQIPPEISGMNLTYVSGTHYSSAGSAGRTEFKIHNVTDNSSMLSSHVEIDSGVMASTNSASQYVINAALDDVVTGDLLRVDVTVIPSASAPKGLAATLGFSLP